MSQTIQAIDVHGHYGNYDRGQPDLVNEFMTGDGELVVRRARQANTRLTMVSPLEALLPRAASPIVDEPAEDRYAESGLRATT